MRADNQQTAEGWPGSAETDARATARASLYLAATLYCDGRSSPAKIRNMSSRGALVESFLTAPAGSLVQLVRGGLIAHGLVAWCSDNRCGLRFSGPVEVARWRAAPTNAEQQRVDEVVRLVKAGAIPLAVPPLAAFETCTEATEAGEQLAADLRRVARLLDRLGEALAEDPAVVENHGPSLQNLDIAGQVLAALDAILVGERQVDATNLADLRRSADQALVRESRP